MIIKVDLFSEENAVLSRAQAALSSGETTICIDALQEVTSHYEKLIRESRRLITRSDRTELEMTRLNARLQQLTTELDYKARHDPLTGVLNRGAIFDKATQLLRDNALSLIVLDIDLFKRINDEFGHPTGDATIQELVVRLRMALDNIPDVEIGRVGGEEFTILLPGTDTQEARNIAESVRSTIAGEHFPCLPSRPVTASFGVCTVDTGTLFETAYAKADAALYDAKTSGRNCVRYA